MTGINQVSTISRQNIAFKAEQSEQPEEKKHPGAAAASFFVPGSGQMLNGETKKGLIHSGLWAGLVAASIATSHSEGQKLFENLETTEAKKLINKLKENNLTKEARKEIKKKIKEKAYQGVSKTKVWATRGLILLGIGLGILSASDAYKGKSQKKPQETEQEK